MKDNIEYVQFDHLNKIWIDAIDDHAPKYIKGQQPAWDKPTHEKSFADIDEILIKHLGPPIDDSHYDSIKSGMREFAQLQAKEAIEEIKKSIQKPVTDLVDGSCNLGLNRAIQIIKQTFDIK